MIDILIHMAAATVIAALLWAIARIGAHWAAAVGAALVMSVRELAQKQAAYGHDFLAGWGDLGWTQLLEGPVSALPAFVLAWWLSREAW